MVLGQDRHAEAADRHRRGEEQRPAPVSYTHLRAHETVLDLVCRLLLEHTKYNITLIHHEYNRY